jgi:acyl-CoA thioesterase
VPTRFDRDTAVRPAGDGHLDARMDPGWFIVRGPNGGYVAAVVLRALTHAVDDPSRTPRSLTVHFTAPPANGPAQVQTRVERRGRSLTTVSGRLVQEGRLLALAIGAFSKPRETFGFDDSVMPDVKPPGDCPRMESRIPIHDRYEHRTAVGAAPFSGGAEALTGGWIRLAEGERPLDAPLLAAFSDAWPPAVFSRTSGEALTAGVPTIDLTVHFRTTLLDPAAATNAWTLAVFRSRLVHEGFIEEDGELWSADGRLLAISRQLALLL